MERRLHTFNAKSQAECPIRTDFSQLVVTHQLNGLAAQQTQVAEFPSLQHQLAEAQVISSGRAQATATRKKLLRTAIRIISRITRGAFRNGRVGKTLESFFRIVGVSDCKTVQFVLRWKEVRVLHSKRLKDARPEKLIKRHARDDFHETAKNVDAQAVFPPRAGAEEQWNSRQSLDVIFDRAVVRQQAVRHVRCFIAFAQIFIPIVGKTGSMRQKVSNRDFTSGGNCVRLTGRWFDEHLGILKLRQIF